MNKNYECLKIYVLRCQLEKYYIGKTTNFARRYNEHLNGIGSEWTKKYPPIDVVEVVTNVDKYDEDKYVWKYMEKYGIDNVRGGSYSQIVLPKSLQMCAQRHINGASDLCFGCGCGGHFINNCPGNGENNSRKRKMDDDDNIDNVERPSKIIKSVGVAKSFNVNNKCSRCGRFGHLVINCYAKTHINGTKL